ncbi:SGNH hydrolase-type esterase domain containing protein [Rhypophila decipiens]
MRVSGYLVRPLALLLALVRYGVQQDAPYDDFTWVERMGIVGDSYTAGIGAGRPVPGGEDCSRWSGSWATIMARTFTRLRGNNIFDLSCSGAKTPEISQQIQSLPGNLDLAVLTAGGNDLCLSSILWSCIFSPWASQRSCDDTINMAHFALQSFFEENVRTLLEELIPKVKTGGIIILAGYAQFFDDTSDGCTNENWSFSLLDAKASLPLSRRLRATLNSLVRQTNQRLASAVATMDRVTFGNVRIGFADWDEWPGAVQGRFCVQGMHTDPKMAVSTLQFIKQDTTIPRHTELRRRDLDSSAGYLDDEYDPLRNRTAERLEYRMARESAERFLASYAANASLTHSKNRIQARGITTPTCPSTLQILNNLIKTPEYLASLFHPTIEGHISMMSYGLNEIRLQRARHLNIPGPGCSQDGPSCIGIPSSAVPYSSYEAVDRQLQPFCQEAARIMQSGNGPRPFSLVREYHRGSPDEVRIRLSFDADVQWPRSGDFETDDCVSDFRAIVNRCITQENPAANPLGFVTGASQRLSLWTYEVTPLRSSGRIWPMPTSKRVEVKGTLYSANNAVSYSLRGTGFATWDRGRSTLLSNFAYCDKRQPIEFAFDYHYPAQDGYEWTAYIQSTAADHTDCMTSGEVIRNSGGPTRSDVEWVNRGVDWLSVCPGTQASQLTTCGMSCCGGFIACGSWCNHFCGGIGHVNNPRSICTDTPVVWQ